jgi:methionine-rich copper-binding protein CopC
MIAASDTRTARPPFTRIVRALMGVAIAFAPALVYPHAIVVAATPPPGADVTAGELDLRLEFNSRIDHGRSQLVLRNADNVQLPVVAKPSAANVLVGHVRISTPGRWTLHWQVLSTDGHITRGDIAFVVRAP